MAKKLQNLTKLYIIFMTMNKRLKLVIGFVALAVMVIITGVCFVFFGNNDIKLKPESISVEKIGGEYYVVAQYNSNYKYRFVLEQKLGDQYYLVDKILNDTNSLKLSEQNLTLTAGAEYRFSACYTTSNNVDGKMSDTVEWRPTWSLSSIDGASIVKTDENITWQAVYQANQYEIIVVDDEAGTQKFYTVNPTFDLNMLSYGHFKLYIKARNTENEYLTDSTAVCVDVNRPVKNVLLSAEYRDGVLSVFSVQNPEQYQVYVNGAEFVQLSYTNSTQVIGGYQVRFENCGAIFASIDFDTDDVVIMSLGQGYLLDSDAVAIL